jgi:hypothetical protein
MQQDSDNCKGSSHSVRYPHSDTLPNINDGLFGGTQNDLNSFDNHESYSYGHGLSLFETMPTQTQNIPPMSNTYEPCKAASTVLNAIPGQFLGFFQAENGSLGEDTQMTTPIPSRKASQVQEVELDVGNPRQDGDCDHSTSGAQIRAEQSQAGKSNVMALHNMLNSSLAPGGADMSSGANRSWAQGSQLRVNQRVSISTTTSYSMMSTCSASTIRAPIDMAESRYYLINRMYQACLDATTSYIQELSFKSKYRTRRYSRYGPYLTTRVSTSIGVRHQPSQCKPPTLMDNISTISTYLWKKARKNLMAPHREEMATVARMSELYQWGRLIVEARDTEGIQNPVAGMENNAILGVFEDGEYHMVRVCKAARELCDWLVDHEAIGICAGVMAELNNLFQKDQDATFADIDV